MGAGRGAGGEVEGGHEGIVILTGPFLKGGEAVETDLRSVPVRWKWDASKVERDLRRVAVGGCAV